MKKITFAVAALLAVGTANAATISGGTVTYGPASTDFPGAGIAVSLAGYDHLSGSLIGVILTLTGHIDTQFDASNSSNSDGLLTGASTTSTMHLVFGATNLVTALPVATLLGTPYTVLANSTTHNVGSLAAGDNSNFTQYNAPPDSTGIVNAFDTNALVNFTVTSLTTTSASTTGGNVSVGQTTNGSGTAHVDFIVADGVPEPASLAMIGGGLTALAYMLRRRKAA